MLVSRLLLLGGYKNLLKEMEADGVKPDTKTFNHLLSIMPSTESSEKVRFIPGTTRFTPSSPSYRHFLYV